jgi:hypothetical protein
MLIKILLFFITVFVISHLSIASEQPDSTVWNGVNVTYSPGEILVGLQSWADESDIAGTLLQISGTVVEDLDRLNIGLIQIPINDDILSAINTLKYDPAVLYAEPNLVMEISAFHPNDPYYAGTAPSPDDYPHQWFT